MVETVVLGLDGLDPAWLTQYLTSGRLPRFRREMSEGRLRAKEVDVYFSDELDMPKTSQAWPSIYTGAGADHHGITTANWTKAGTDFVADVPSTVFDDLSHAGLTVHSYRMAMTWPARDISGWMLSGFPSGTSDGVDDSEAWGLPTSSIPDDYNTVQDHYVVRHADTINAFIEAERRKFEICTGLLDRTGDPDVLFYGTQLPDKAGHYVTDFDEEMDRATDEQYEFIQAYVRMDDLLGWVLDELDPDRIFGVSDHGFQRYFGGHSHRAAALEWTAEGVDPALDQVESVLDVRAYLCDVHGVEQSSKYNLYNGEDDVDDITEEARDAAVDRLEDLGYL